MRNLVLFIRHCWSDCLGRICWLHDIFCNRKTWFVRYKKAVIPNAVGVVCGMAIISLSNAMPTMGNLGVWCAVVTFIMCIIAKTELFDFCPGTFVGCFTTFAADGQWNTLIPSLVIGAVLGLACDLGSRWLYKELSKQ